MTTQALDGFTFLDSPAILVVDDEELLREVVSLMISDRGGEPVAVGTGTEAVELFAANPSRYRYAFIDFSMPKMNGYETWKALRKIDPAFLAIVCSGLRITDEVETAWRNSELEFLSKPFLENELMAAFARLERRKGAAPTTSA